MVIFQSGIILQVVVIAVVCVCVYVCGSGSMPGIEQGKASEELPVPD